MSVKANSIPTLFNSILNITERILEAHREAPDHFDFLFKHVGDLHDCLEGYIVRGLLSRPTPDQDNRLSKVLEACEHVLNDLTMSRILFHAPDTERLPHIGTISRLLKEFAELRDQLKSLVAKLQLFFSGNEIYSKVPEDKIQEHRDSFKTPIASIASHHSRCYAGFASTLSCLQTEPHRFPDSISFPDVSNEFDRYKLWSGNVGAAHEGQNYRISLDYRLREAPFWKEQICSILMRLADTLERTSSLLQGTVLPFEAEASPDVLSIASESDSSSSDEEETMATPKAKNERQKLNRIRASIAESEDLLESPHLTQNLPDEDIAPLSRAATLEMPQLLETLRFTISCLYRIPLRRPATLDRLKISNSDGFVHFEPFDVSYINDRCPNATANLKYRLVKMTLNRRRLLDYRSKHYKRMKPAAHIILPHRETKGNVNFPESEPSQRQYMAQSEVESSKPSQLTKATTLQANEFIRLTPSLVAPDNVSVAQSAASSKASSWTGSQKLFIPPRPKDSTNGKAFLCPYCFVICKAIADHNWKHHVLRDLEPYICTFDNCDFKTSQFESRDEWYEHELQNHRVEWCCNLEDHPPYSDSASFVEHLKSDHSSLHLAVKSPEILQTFRRPKQTHGDICPFCPQIPKKPKNHISRHMEQIALYVLGGNNGEDSDTENASNDAKRAGSSDESLGSDFEQSDEDEPFQSPTKSDPAEDTTDTETTDLPDIPDGEGAFWKVPLHPVAIFTLLASVIQLLKLVSIAIGKDHDEDRIPGFEYPNGPDSLGVAVSGLLSLEEDVVHDQQQVGYLTDIEKSLSAVASTSLQLSAASQKLLLLNIPVTDLQRKEYRLLRKLEITKFVLEDDIIKPLRQNEIWDLASLKKEEQYSSSFFSGNTIIRLLVDFQENNEPYVPFFGNYVEPDVDDDYVLTQDKLAFNWDDDSSNEEEDENEDEHEHENGNEDEDVAPVISKPVTAPGEVNVEEREAAIIRSLEVVDLRERYNSIEDGHRSTLISTLNGAMDFKNWMSGQDPYHGELSHSLVSQPYLIHGSAGCGKSVFMKSLFANEEFRVLLTTWSGQALSPGPLRAVFCFCWDSMSSYRTTWVHVLRKILFDLLHQWRGSVLDLFPALSTRIPQVTFSSGLALDVDWEAQELQNAIMLWKESYQGRLAIFIDGLDEIDEFREAPDKKYYIAYFLERLADEKVKICLAGQDLNFYQERQHHRRTSLYLDLLTPNSIKRYAYAALVLSKDSDFPSRTESIQDVLDTIVEKAGGNMLWAVLATKWLLSSRSPDPMKALRQLPASLHGLYGFFLRNLSINRLARFTRIANLVSRNATNPGTFCEITLSFELELDGSLRHDKLRNIGHGSAALVKSRLDKARERFSLDFDNLICSGDNRGVPLMDSGNLCIRYVHRSFKSYFMMPETQSFISAELDQKEGDVHHYSFLAPDYTSRYLLRLWVLRLKFCFGDRPLPSEIDIWGQFLDEIMCLAKTIQHSGFHQEDLLVLDELATVVDGNTPVVFCSDFTEYAMFCGLWTYGRSYWMMNGTFYKQRSKDRPPCLYLALIGPNLDTEAVKFCLSAKSLPNEIFAGLTIWQHFLLQVLTSAENLHPQTVAVMIQLLGAGADPNPPPVPVDDPSHETSIRVSFDQIVTLLFTENERGQLRRAIEEYQQRLLSENHAEDSILEAGSERLRNILCPHPDCADSTQTFSTGAAYVAHYRSKHRGRVMVRDSGVDEIK